MRFCIDYQKRAAETDRLGAQRQNPLTVALFGLAGETGSLHTLYKKRLRDGDQFTGFREKVKEEPRTSSSHLHRQHRGVTPERDCSSQPRKRRLRAGCLPARTTTGSTSTNTFLQGSSYRGPLMRSSSQPVEDGVSKVEVFVDGQKCGAKLNDNSYVSDGYRFHDIFHMTCAALLGWSPVVRALMKKKRKSDKQTDDVEDGGRAIATDEALAAIVFNYAFRHTIS